MKVYSKRQQKKTKPRNEYLIKPRVMTRGSEKRSNPKRETHSDKMIKLHCQKEAHTKRDSF